MRKSIKKMVFIRVVAALISVLLFSGVTTFNLIRVDKMQTRSIENVAMLTRAQSAETAQAIQDIFQGTYIPAFEY